MNVCVAVFTLVCRVGDVPTTMSASNVFCARKKYIPACAHLNCTPLYSVLKVFVLCYFVKASMNIKMVTIMADNHNIAMMVAIVKIASSVILF